jgi:hypothetical protein
MSMLNGLLAMEKGKFQPCKIGQWYLKWLNSPPFDIGNTTINGLSNLKSLDLSND